MGRYICSHDEREQIVFVFVPQPTQARHRELFGVYFALVIGDNACTSLGRNGVAMKVPRDARSYKSGNK